MSIIWKRIIPPVVSTPTTAVRSCCDNYEEWLSFFCDHLYGNHVIIFRMSDIKYLIPKPYNSYGDFGICNFFLDLGFIVKAPAVLSCSFVSRQRLTLLRYVK